MLGVKRDGGVGYVHAKFQIEAPVQSQPGLAQPSFEYKKSPAGITIITALDRTK